jgi:hypothetical protein
VFFMYRYTTDTFLFISHTTNALLFKFRCNSVIGVRIVKEMPGSVASGTSCISIFTEATGTAAVRKFGTAVGDELCVSAGDMSVILRVQFNYLQVTFR